MAAGRYTIDTMKFARSVLPILSAVAVFGGAFILSGNGAHAQLGNVDPLTITISPQYPKPYQIVTVTPDSSYIDLSSSQVTISVNGAVVERGSGTQGASVAVGGPGKATTITVTASANGQTYTKSLTIHPADVALLVEPQSTTHPFYEGAPLIASEGRVRVVALPDLRTSSGDPIPPSSLVYTWKNGDQILQDQSGIGKSVLTAVAPVRYRDTTLSLTVATQNSSVVAYAQTAIAPTDPFVRMYENDPLLGPRFENALSNSVALTDSEKTYRAVPYFFASIPSISWQVNGAPSQSGQDITVRPTGSGKGTALLGVSASASGQLANTSLSVQFGVSQSTGIFGL